MIKKFWKSKKGVTLLEGLIAMVLLAVVATGSFAVLLSASRKSSGPDIREEMILAVEKAHMQLQAYVFSRDFTLTKKDSENEDLVPLAYQNGLCGHSGTMAVDDTTPLASGTHNIKCLLPLICDSDAADDCNGDTGSKSCFVYRVNPNDVVNAKLPKTARERPLSTNWNTGVYNTADGVQPQDISSGKTIHFEIRCNGYTLTR
ncbi:type IV pilus modification PilV family protein [Candidatus Avelusimicrobium faecicola]|uniref:type IV pilus modification PilV family protein n=1 Tax=Candidatus Avelusimicrobium faecicola TaxID=3416205 RepID=UPI003D0E37EE